MFRKGNDIGLPLPSAGRPHPEARGISRGPIYVYFDHFRILMRFRQWQGALENFDIFYNPSYGVAISLGMMVDIEKIFSDFIYFRLIEYSPEEMG